MREFKFKIIHVFILFFCWHFYWKLRKSGEAQDFLRRESLKWDQFDFRQNEELNELVKRTRYKQPAVLLLNQEGRFAQGDGRYQLFQYFRAKLCAYLSEVVERFSMIQADTIWRKNLFKVIDFNMPEYETADLIVDSEGETGLLAEMIAGGYFFVHSSTKTRHFFQEVADHLLSYYATDNNLMARQCVGRHFDVYCVSIPYSILSNWRQRIDTNPPFFQYDGGENSAQKFQKMHENGYLFVDQTTLNINTSLQLGRTVKCLPTHQFFESRESARENDNKKSPRGNFGLRFGHEIFENLCVIFPWTKKFVLTKLFPFYASYLAIT